MSTTRIVTTQVFTETLGFDLVQSTPMGTEAGALRWIEVAPPDRNVLLVLYTPDEQRDRIGTFSNVLFDCDDIHATYTALQVKGVTLIQAPVPQFWGWWAVFQDLDGNTYGLGQRRA